MHLANASGCLKEQIAGFRLPPWPLRSTPLSMLCPQHPQPRRHIGSLIQSGYGMLPPRSFAHLPDRIFRANRERKFNRVARSVDQLLGGTRQVHGVGIGPPCIGGVDEVVDPGEEVERFSGDHDDRPGRTEPHGLVRGQQRASLQVFTGPGR